tara:strand:+ start:261 stop:383 length:123 start_codon:yes stop_codon:yes gene_type:complete
MSTLKGTVKWFNGKKALGSLNERIKRKMHLCMPQPLKRPE